MAMHAKDIQVGKTYRLARYRRLKRVDKIDRGSHYPGGTVIAKDVLDDGTLRPCGHKYAGDYFASEIIECVQEALTT
jgi:hypothetical protein